MADGDKEMKECKPEEVTEPKELSRFHKCIDELYTMLTQVQLGDGRGGVEGKQILQKYQEFNMMCDQLSIKLHSSLLDINEFRKRVEYSPDCSDTSLKDDDYSSILELRKTIQNMQTLL